MSTLVAQEVERCELVSDLRGRLNGRPTLAIALKGRGRLLIAGAIGFGQTTEIANYLDRWRTPVSRWPAD